MKPFTIYCTLIFTFCLFITCKEKNPEEVLALEVCAKVCGETVTNTMVAGGGTAPYTFQWTGDLGGSTSNPFVTTPTSPGSHTVTGTVTDANGCTQQSTNTINVSLPVLNVVNTPDLVCPDNINLNIYIGGSTTSPYSFYNGSQSPCNPTSPVGTPTSVILADGENIFTVCNGNLGSGGTCCDCETFTLWSTCDPANSTYNVVQLGDDLCDDGQICFEVDLSPCEAPTHASFTETVTWTSTPGASGTESDDGTTYQICYTQAQLTAAGIDGGDNFNVQVGIEITNSNTGSASCGDTNAADIDIVIETCCNCVIGPLDVVAEALNEPFSDHIMVEIFSVDHCGFPFAFTNIFGDGVDNDETFILNDIHGCGLSPNGATIFTGGAVSASSVESTMQSELDSAFGAGELTVTFDGTNWSITGTCGHINNLYVEFARPISAQTPGCTQNILIVGTGQAETGPNAACCP